jgi:HD-GYP domain-containing protein (c-di-GMP phosphodiesterase class II)
LRPDPEPRGTWAVAVVLGSGAVVIRMSLGHLGSFVASASFIVVGASSLGQLPTEPYNAPFWISHLMDVAGVGTATIAGLVAYRQRSDLREAMSPIVSLDPLKALEIGMDPTVHAFVAQLARKDQITRDHVVRVGELASRIGVRAGLNPDRLSALGIPAVLHDIGKLNIDDSILSKPGRLTSDEYSQMQTHAAAGAALLEASPALVPAVPFVLAHHERPDGAGYPNDLQGDEMPTEARIIGACDAFDAIAHTRQYRKGRAPNSLFQSCVNTQAPSSMKRLSDLLPSRSAR